MFASGRKFSDSILSYRVSHATVKLTVQHQSMLGLVTYVTKASKLIEFKEPDLLRVSNAGSEVMRGRHNQRCFCCGSIVDCTWAVYAFLNWNLVNDGNIFHNSLNVFFVVDEKGI